jgi:hypothetical protein
MFIEPPTREPSARVFPLTETPFVTPVGRRYASEEQRTGLDNDMPGI